MIIRLMRISSKSGLRSRKILFSAYSGFTLSLYLGFFLPGFTTCAPEPEGSATDAGGASEGFGEGKPAVDGANQANSKGGLPALRAAMGARIAANKSYNFATCPEARKWLAGLPWSELNDAKSSSCHRI